MIRITNWPKRLPNWLKRPEQRPEQNVSPRRRRNPEITWQIAVITLFGAALFGGLVTSMSMKRRSLSSSTRDVYYYWAQQDEQGHWTPMIQNSRTGQIFALPGGKLAESSALFDAKKEIQERGGEPQKGQPIGA